MAGAIIYIFTGKLFTGPSAHSFFIALMLRACLPLQMGRNDDANVAMLWAECLLMSQEK